MSDMDNLVAMLDNQVRQLMQQHALLTQRYQQAHQKVAQLEEKLQQSQQQLTAQAQEIQTLKTANALLGSEENRREIKLRINSLIRDIDACMAQLND